MLIFFDCLVVYFFSVDFIFTLEASSGSADNSAVRNNGDSMPVSWNLILSSLDCL